MVYTDRIIGWNPIRCRTLWFVHPAPETGNAGSIRGVHQTRGFFALWAYRSRVVKQRGHTCPGYREKQCALLASRRVRLCARYSRNTAFEVVWRSGLTDRSPWKSNRIPHSGHRGRNAEEGRGTTSSACPIPQRKQTMNTLLWRIRHPILALRHWRTMRDAERRFGPFPPAPF